MWCASSYVFFMEKVSNQRIFTKKLFLFGNIMNRQNVTKWCHHFSEGRTDVHDEQSTCRPSVIFDALLQRTEEAVRALGHHLGGKSFHDDDEIKDEVEKFGSDNRRQPSMTVGYKS
ncbi:hypothetical protein TNCV_2014811 [Trichonephila clavipes]|nr:hypothetical protein TNCV_2014811 [Trichonephila clavipes]